MEELSGCFEGLAVPSSPKQHPRFSQFKVKALKISQEERRKLTLESQKQKRFDCQNFIRKLTADDNLPSGNAESNNIPDEMDWQICTKKYLKPARLYCGQLMLSEWLLKDQIPSHFETDWIIVGCPVGKRCLVVASKVPFVSFFDDAGIENQCVNLLLLISCVYYQGQTKVYSKSGFKVIEFNSLLPGGGFQTQKNTDSTILDCVWVEKNQSYYVLDIICWGKILLLNCESQFRFYWINSKWKDEPDLTLKCRQNRYPFLSLPSTPCESKANMERFVIGTLSENWSLDGFLFYHKSGHYIPGNSPLVLWLKPSMLPEILNVAIPDVYIKTKSKNCADVMDISIV